MIHGQDGFQLPLLPRAGGFFCCCFLFVCFLSVRYCSNLWPLPKK